MISLDVTVCADFLNTTSQKILSAKAARSGLFAAADANVTEHFIINLRATAPEWISLYTQLKK